jgi:CubicO group peptidase (beta-lactamase class C family)
MSPRKQNIYALKLLVIVLMCSLYGKSQNVRYEVTLDSLNKIKQYMAQPDMQSAMGYSVLLAYKDSVIALSHYGIENREKKTSVTNATQFYIASVAKTFTATAILKLKQEKKLDLSDKIAKFLPDLPAYAKDVRIYHLLTHLSGIKDYYDEYGETLPFTGNTGVMDFLRKQDSLLFDPAVSMSYSNTGYVLLSMIVEKISGKSFSEYVQTNLLNIAGMQNTVFDKPGVTIRNKAIGYTIDSSGSFGLNDFKSAGIIGPGGYYSTISDIHKWMVALKKGNIITQRTLDAAWSFPITLTGSKSYLGMGWSNESWGPRTPAVSGLRCYGAIGILNGFRAILLYVPDLDVHAVLLSNSGDFPLRLEKIIGMLVKRTR